MAHGTDSARWIIGIDGTEASTHALRWSLTQLRNRNATLVAVTVWSPTVGEPNRRRAIERPLGRARSILDRSQEDARRHGVALHKKALRGDPSDVLMAEAEAGGLLVLGTRRRSGLHRRVLGSVSEVCAGRSVNPVIIVPDSSDATAEVKKIVAGVDGSRNAAAALRWALEFAPDPSCVVALGALGTRGSRADSEPHLRAFNTAVEAALPAEVAVERRFLIDDPASALTGQRSDMIALGARSRSAMAATVLGSVTTEVIRRASAPVAIVRSKGEPPS